MCSDDWFDDLAEYELYYADDDECTSRRKTDGSSGGNGMPGMGCLVIAVAVIILIISCA